jgi:carbamoyl-phosphate synthase small subunit
VVSILRASLSLEDGTVFHGTMFGGPAGVSGEVVFNTAMSGYIEALTDPSYRGQILVLTYPLIGNYGVPAPRPVGSLEGPYESDRIQVLGLVVQQACERYSHVDADRSLSQWLRAEKIPGLAGIDTRTLTRRLREAGTMKGRIVPQGNGAPGAEPLTEVDMPLTEVDMSDVAGLVAPAEPRHYAAGDLTVLLVDMGAKDNIVRSLLARDVSVLRAGWRSDLCALARQVDGILIGNGPGDPKNLAPLVEQTRRLMSDFGKPIFGLCLGHQILALAAGGDTYKLKYGHRGINQPVQDLLTRRCYITSQNHGFAVREGSLPQGWEPWFVNLNDGTNEGIRAHRKPIFSVQFHPEAAPGPRDTGFLFDDFVRLVGAMKAG